MKMFNWVQKKLNCGSDYHRVSSGRAPGVFTETERKGESRLVACGEKNSGTLRHNMLDNILAIGSFDHGHGLLPYSTVEEYLQQEVKEDDLRMVTMLHTATGPLISSKHHPPSLLKPLQRKPSIKEVVKDGKKDHKKKMMEVVMIEHVQRSSCELVQPLLDKKRKEKKTTLADLLAIEASLSRKYSSIEKSSAEAIFITMSSIA